MKFQSKVIFLNLKLHISDAIKESCYKSDVRFYNIANEVFNVPTFGLGSEVEFAQGLTMIIDHTVKASVEVGCDLSVIVKGIMLGAFRSRPYIPGEAPKTIGLLINEILQVISKDNGDVDQAVEGILSAIVIIAMEFKFNAQEALIVAREDILSFAKKKSPEFADKVNDSLPELE